MSHSERGLQLVSPLPDDPRAWQHLLNFLYLHEEDDLFRWCKRVQEEVTPVGGTGEGFAKA